MSTVRGAAAARGRARGAAGGDLPGRLDHRRAQAARHADHRRARAGAARRLHRARPAGWARRAISIWRSRSAPRCVRGGRLALSVGGGIVADSTPDGELAETEVKARAFAALCGGATACRAAATRRPPVSRLPSCPTERRPARRAAGRSQAARRGVASSMRKAARHVAAEELDDEAQRRVERRGSRAAARPAGGAGGAAAATSRAEQRQLARRLVELRRVQRGRDVGAAGDGAGAAQLVEGDAAARERDRPGARRSPCRSSSRRRSSRAGRTRARGPAPGANRSPTTRERPALAPREAQRRPARRAATPP